MADLRHIKGPVLTELEKQLAEIKLPIVLQNVQRVGRNWYINFLVQGIQEKSRKPVKKEIAKKTKTIRS